MKKLILILTVSVLALSSCSKDKEGCNDRRASNYNELVVVDDGSCVFTALTFYADSSHVNNVQISSIDVTVGGVVVGSFSGYFPSGSEVCDSPNTAVYNTKGESTVSWSATINFFVGTSIVRSGDVTGIIDQKCVTQQILP